MPFAGIAFLWFIGVLRDRLGELEDQCFATVFLGSGLLFVAMMFASAAVNGGIIMAYRARPAAFLDSAMYTFAHAVAYEIMDLYAVKMAAVFMISTSTVAIYTGMFARAGRRPVGKPAQNHPFIDGNKRTGFAATYTFVAINDARIAADAKAAYVFIAGLYESNDFTFEKLAAWLRDNVEPASP